ncbi:MAG TPA: helix-turn-helix domain-containing protein [Acidisoma sp.]|jgi:CRP/FNR family nitrogen fixation transcriptional regulator|nr:helix-turn-helix domain-containing protein [Acidisoma sp.]
MSAALSVISGTKKPDFIRPMIVKMAREAKEPNAGDFPRSVVYYAANQQIYGESDIATRFYSVISGTVRTCRFLIDGRRQIDGFHCAGDIFGIEAGATHAFSAEAVSDCTLAAFRQHNVAAMTLHNAELSRLLFSYATRSMRRAQEHALLLGIRSAQERVATFLMGWAKQCKGGTVAELAMTRQDIADHLGLTIETVSRTFTVLEQEKRITMRNPRQVHIQGLWSLSHAADEITATRRFYMRE